MTWDLGDVTRVVVIVECVGTAGMLWWWMRPRMKLRLLTPGEVLTRTGILALLLAVSVARVEELLAVDEGARLPLYFVASTWMFIGMILTLRQGTGVRYRVPPPEDGEDPPE